MILRSLLDSPVGPSCIQRNNSAMIAEPRLFDNQEMGSNLSALQIQKAMGGSLLNACPLSNRPPCLGPVRPFSFSNDRFKGSGKEDLYGKQILFSNACAERFARGSLEPLGVSISYAALRIYGDTYDVKVSDFFVDSGYPFHFRKLHFCLSLPNSLFFIYYNINDCSAPSVG